MQKISDYVQIILAYGIESFYRHRLYKYRAYISLITIIMLIIYEVFCALRQSLITVPIFFPL